jgi:biotin carboxyl carrier protein
MPTLPEPSETTTLMIHGSTYETTLTRKFQNRKPWTPRDPKRVACVIPGIIQKLYVKPGSTVLRGEPLVVLEAMKMQNDIVAPEDGKVKKILVEPGAQVAKGQVLLEFW